MILHMQGDQEKILYDACKRGNLEVINSCSVEEARINWRNPDDVSVFFLQTFLASVHSVIMLNVCALTK